MNAATIRWRKVLWDFLEEVRTFLGTGEETYKVTSFKLAKALQGGLTLAAPGNAS
jgi:hypothetical protein